MRKGRTANRGREGREEVSRGREGGVGWKGGAQVLRCYDRQLVDVTWHPSQELKKHQWKRVERSQIAFYLKPTSYYIQYWY